VKGPGVKGSIKIWIPLLVWVVLIFGLSSIPRLSVDCPGLPAFFDKPIHFIEYMILAVLLHRVIGYDSERNRSIVCTAILVTGIGIAAIDELYQGFVPGRESSITDVIADAAGVVVGALAALLRQWIRIKKAERL
jgi:VanZ family protein